MLDSSTEGRHREDVIRLGVVMVLSLWRDLPILNVLEKESPDR